VVIVGYASSRELTQASFQFKAVVGAELEPSSLTVPIDALFSGTRVPRRLRTAANSHSLNDLPSRMVPSPSCRCS
jgi:hypothetical protein